MDPQKLMEYAREWINLTEYEQRNQLFIRDNISLFTVPQFHAVLHRLIREQDKKQYYYMITFTLKEGADEEKALDYVLRLPDRVPLQVSKAHYVEEKTKKGTKHWHMSIQTTKALKKDRVSYYEQKFGHIDISKNKAQQYDEMLEYMSKTDEIIQLK